MANQSWIAQDALEDVVARLTTPAVHEMRLAAGPARVRLWTSSLDLAWHVWSYLHYPPTTEAGGWHVFSELNQQSWHERLWTELNRDGQEAILEYSTTGQVIDRDGLRMVGSNRTGTVTIVNRDDRTCVLIGGNELRNLFIDTYKALRQIIEFQLYQRGEFVALHASAVSYAGQGIAFLGPKGSGKTTMMLATLNEFGPRVGFVSNDGPRIGPLSGAEQYLWPMPTLVGLGIGSIQQSATRLSRLNRSTLAVVGETRDWVLDQQVPWDLVDRLPTMTPQDRWRIKEKVWITPRELAYVTGCALEAGVPMRLAVFPTIDPDRRGKPDLVRMTDEDKALAWRDNLVWGSTWYRDWLGLGFVDRSAAASRWLKLLLGVPAFRLSIGLDTTDAPSAVLARL